ncbi:MAG TPA: right-handed parallel beta-helix repeat-containing protein, partial [Hanamia sp.]|nr:right-handed parallel beta-helix repeat-containing protein [Hanamia sp.]
MLKRKSTYVFFLFLSLTFLSNSYATTYYLSSSSGNDGNSGTSSSSPWQSISKLNSFRNFKPGDNILFKRGDIFYGSINIVNSGGSGSPITLSAYGSGAKPVITGFTSVTSWKNIGSNLWESTYSVSSLNYTNMVSVNGKNTAMGRYPNSTGPNTGYLTVTSFSGTSSISGNGVSGINWSGADVVIRKAKYYLDRGDITSQSGSTIYYAGNSTAAQNGDGFFIQNDSRTLDMTGEWYYDPSSKKIRIYSYSTPSNVKVASVETLLNISGAYVTIDNLILTGANSHAIYISNSSNHNVVVQNCDISFCGIDGIYCDQPYVTVQNNTFRDLNSDGIKLVRPNGVIKNNVIRAVNVFEGMGQGNAMGGICVSGSYTTIQNNEVDSCGFKGIIFSGLNTLVKNNLVNTYCFVREDGAGIYTGNNGSSGSVIDGNIILNGIGAKKGTVDSLNNDLSGISIDDYGTGITISNNTIANCVSIGIKLHLANNITVKNNTTYNNGGSSWSKGGLEILFNGSNPINNISLNGNIFFAKNTNQLSVFASTAGNTAGIKELKTDNNYYAKPIASSTPILIDNNSFTLSTWQSYIDEDFNSKIAPKSISNLSDLRFEYNATSQSKTIPLDATYIDVKNNSYNGSITLSPYCSAVLIKTGASTTTSTTNLLPAVNPSNVVNGLDYKYYQASSYSVLPDFNSLSPVKTGSTSTFDISIANRNYSYSINYSGYIDVPADGQYTFYTTSDDGSKLYIDNVLVVNNDGIHASLEKSGTIGLKAGKHAITVGFFQQEGGNVLSVSYEGPSLSKRVIPNSALFRTNS